MIHKTRGNAMHILRTNDVISMTGLSRTTIWRMERSGQFPKRVQLGAKCVGWIEGEVIDWIETRPRVGDHYNQQRS